MATVGAEKTQKAKKASLASSSTNRSGPKAEAAVKKRKKSDTAAISGEAKLVKKTAKREKPDKASAETNGGDTEQASRKAVVKTTERYFEAVGRRKTAVARARLFTKGERQVLVNERLVEAYFPSLELRELALAALKRMKVIDKFRVLLRVNGGGIHAQAEALRHATARALVKFNPDFRKRLKRAGFLRRDPRMVERKKPGLKKARKAPQWAKR